MVGIIINDSIVLVTTIDEYGETRGLVPAIIDGTSDRLRPVLLTTLTTVLGLAPLLYESSTQAQFLKPTVITLVYGLGFGMVLVLLVVPALLAAGQDLAANRVALRRAVRAPALSRLVLGGGAIIAALFAVTLGAVIIGGALPAPIASMLPADLSGSIAVAFALFTAGAALVTLLLGLIGALVLRPRAS